MKKRLNTCKRFANLLFYFAFFFLLLLSTVGYDANLIVSSLSSDGVLTVTAPRIGLPAPKVEKYVPIWHTGKPAIEDKK